MMDFIVDTLVGALDRLDFGSPVTHVYNPLKYARNAHNQYLARFGRSPKEVVFVGMNPGPWGMAQSGVPFGEIAAVRDWMGICASVDSPANPHPKRPVTGFQCNRSEVSGRRLWGWAMEMFDSPDLFFQRFFVANYCPLIFFEASGKNRTPDKLRVNERRPLFDACDQALLATIKYLKPRYVIGVGEFARKRSEAALSELTEPSPVIDRIAHPSPANPLANRGWASLINGQLASIGIEIP